MKEKRSRQKVEVVYRRASKPAQLVAKPILKQTQVNKKLTNAVGSAEK